jgi:two-component system, OmpR family, response regulator RpaB
MPDIEGTPNSPLGGSTEGSAPVSRPGTERRVVLLICENSTVSRREVLPVLRSAGYEVIVAEAQVRVLPDLLSKPYAVIVLDISARDGTPYDLCQQLRAGLATPIMLVLRGGARECVLRGFECGADTYVLAPFDPREFEARLRSLTWRSDRTSSPV